MTYSEKLKDPRWQRKRLEVMQRDGFVCRDCGASDKTLEVHHCGYRGDGPWDTPNNLLLTVCTDCHKFRQDVEREIKRAIEESFAASSPDGISAVADMFTIGTTDPDFSLAICVHVGGTIIASSSRLLMHHIEHLRSRVKEANA